ncbi:VTT domain-containing protein [Edaphobacter modestus]|uniref:Membrane protein DedA with SNARE-associated domain n=1 Tax=Edaphobacter modestus TaxID=388466 RepID=A0A4Q7YR59_9BACT|nr:VTT domain-containing protein [Edaphobacter modestus]RZU39654.1 membrane protein DedA with SNARE-associated domain [Edaphobacter modestus]
MPIALAFFVHYAYLILFLWVLVEQLGVPVPSIPVLLTAGTLSATHRINHSYALLAVLAACLLSDSMWFALGRRYGNSVLRLLCRLSFEASTCVSKTEGYFIRRGPATLLFSKFVPGLSTVAPPIAGQIGMPYGRFLLWDMAGSFLWAETFLLAGRFFGDLAQRSASFFHWLGHFAFAIFVLMVMGLMAHRILKQRKFLRQVRKLRLEPEELKAMIDLAQQQGNTPPFIVDLRHPLDYLPDPRVLPGALRVGPNEIRQHSEIIPRDRDVVLYCTCPSEETSAKLALQLHKMGVYRVRPLRGGFDGWKNAGYPLVDYIVDTPTTAVLPGQIAPAPSSESKTALPVL